MISKVTQVKLRRLSELSAVIARDGDEMGCEPVYAEYRTLVGEVVEEVEPFVRLLVKAGLLQVDLEVTPVLVEEVASGEYDSLTYEIKDTYVNAGIVLIPEHFSCAATYSKEHDPNGK